MGNNLNLKSKSICMKFPLSWLKDYIDINMQPQQIAKTLTLLGIEVDSIEKAALKFDKVVVGQVLSVQPHPNADKLCLAEVTDGIERFQVVCGAPNCREGMKTALAVLGATLTFPDGEQIKVKKAKIRGVESFGMLCSGVELGISEDQEGIMDFADYIQVGADVGEIYSDAIFEVSLTPNLSHSASLIGIARELSAATGAPLKMPLIYVEEVEKNTSLEASIQIKDRDNCPCYAARVIENIGSVESPEWLKKRLLACGIRPVHVAVDVTNYVLIEMGHPLHAFDLDTIEQGGIIVRKSFPGEKIQTLDGKERTLTEGTLLIADKSRPLAIAGIMGGKDSEVAEGTKRILIESAYFKPSCIRLASKALALSTDASKRFERGVDLQGVLPALDRASMLLSEIIGEAKVLKGPLKVQAQEFSELQIRCRVKRVNDLLGTHLSLSEVESILQRLRFITKEEDQETLLVTVPSYRIDVKAEIDLIEEVARLIGYNNIPRQETAYRSSTLDHHPLFYFERGLRQRLIAQGLQEFLTCDLVGPSLLNIVPDPKIPKSAIVHVLNPTSIEQSILRTSLLQGLVQVVKFNHDRENPNVRGFELGRVHFKIGEQYEEPTVVGIILSGKNSPPHIDPKPRAVDFFDLKGMIENLFEGLNIKHYVFRFSQYETFHSGRQALIQVDGMDVGCLGEIHPAIQRKLDISERIYFAELNISDLLQAKKGNLMMRPIAEYPSSTRDWTLTVKEAVSIHQLIGSIQHIPSKLLEEVSLVDIFRSEKLGLGIKNVTLHFVYRDKAKTLSQEEVDTEHSRIITAGERMLRSLIHENEPI